MSFLTSIPVWGWFDIGFTLLVLVALCGESDWAAKRLISEKPNDVVPIEGRHKKLKKRCEFLLILGIAGELACLPFSLLDSSELNQEAGSARKDAGAAMERAANAEKEAGQANERAAKFDADRVMVEKEAEEIRSTNFVLQAKLLELEGKLQPRVITSEQQTNLIASLSRASSKGKISVFASILDAEAASFAEQISNVLAQAGFEVHCPLGFSGDAMLALGPPGAHLVVKDVKKPSRAAYIQRCFTSAGIILPAMNSGDANFGSNSVEIDVGQR